MNHPIVRMIAIGLIFCVVTVAWLILGGINESRSNKQRYDLRGQVAELWGSAQTQAAPGLSFRWVEEREQTRTETVDGVAREIRERVRTTQTQAELPDSSDIEVSLHDDPRRKGLVWYALYDVDFQGRWTYKHDSAQPGTLDLSFAFPDTQGIYDGFRFVVDGVDQARSLTPQNGQVVWSVPVEPQQEVTLEIGYKSRGLDEWRYRPNVGVSSLENFSLRMNTDFRQIDYPSGALSPSSRDETGAGWALRWSFERAVTGRDIGMVVPKNLQPGELAAAMSFSAPISLFFFFLILFVLGTLRGIDIHPINYVMLAGAFFAFHLLFSYAVDHLEVVPAFVLSGAVSVVLVVSYLRLVVSARFAFVEAAAAQVVYLIGFSVAHFWDGFTGLTVTVLSILTLFLLMQLTGRIRWSEALQRRPAEAR